MAEEKEKEEFVVELAIFKQGTPGPVVGTHVELPLVHRSLEDAEKFETWVKDLVSCHIPKYW